MVYFHYNAFQWWVSSHRDMMHVWTQHFWLTFWTLMWRGEWAPMRGWTVSMAIFRPLHVGWFWEIACPRILSHMRRRVYLPPVDFILFSLSFVGCHSHMLTWLFRKEFFIAVVCLLSGRSRRFRRCCTSTPASLGLKRFICVSAWCSKSTRTMSRA